MLRISAVPANPISRLVAVLEVNLIPIGGSSMTLSSKCLEKIWVALADDKIGDSEELVLQISMSITHEEIFEYSER